MGILEECTPENVADAERFWICSFRAAGAILMNMTDGGEGTAGYKWNVEDRDNLSANQRERLNSPEGKKIQSEGQKRRFSRPEEREANRLRQVEVQAVAQARPDVRAKKSASMKGKNVGKKASEETREKMRLAHLGQVPWIKGKGHSQETKDKISLAQIGRKQTIEHVENRFARLRRPVRSADGREFKCVREVAELLGTTISVVRGAILRQKPLNGVMFQWA